MSLHIYREPPSLLQMLEICKQLTQNPSHTHGWVFLYLCFGCFASSYYHIGVPSVSVHQVSYALYCEERLRKTQLNSSCY